MYTRQISAINLMSLYSLFMPYVSDKYGTEEIYDRIVWTL